METNAFEYSNFLLCQTWPGGTFCGGMLNCVPVWTAWIWYSTSVVVKSVFCTEMNFDRVFPLQVACFLSPIKSLKDFVDPVSVVVDFFFSSVSDFVWSVNTWSCSTFFTVFDYELHSNVFFSYGLSRYPCSEEGDLSVFGVNFYSQLR